MVVAALPLNYPWVNSIANTLILNFVMVYTCSTEIVEEVKANRNPPFRPGIDSTTTDATMIALMRSCWEQTPYMRPSFTSILHELQKSSKGKWVLRLRLFRCAYKGNRPLGALMAYESGSDVRLLRVVYRALGRFTTCPVTIWTWIWFLKKAATHIHRAMLLGGHPSVLFIIMLSLYATFITEINLNILNIFMAVFLKLYGYEYGSYRKHFTVLEDYQVLDVTLMQIISSPYIWTCSFIY